MIKLVYVWVCYHEGVSIVSYMTKRERESKRKKRKRSLITGFSLIALISGLFFIVDYTNVSESDLTKGSWVVMDIGSDDEDLQTVLTFNDRGRVTTSFVSRQSPFTKQNTVGKQLTEAFLGDLDFHSTYSISKNKLTMRPIGNLDITYDVEWVDWSRDRLRLSSQISGDVIILIHSETPTSIDDI